MKKDDVLRLAKGKATSERVGSRAIPHRLNQLEMVKFGVAKEKGFLEVPEAHRVALRNTWNNWCEASGNPTIVVVHGTENSELYVGNACIATYNTRKEAKQAAAAYAKQ